MRRHVVDAVPLSPADDQGGDQASHAGVDMDHGAAGEVEHSRATEKPAAPHPMGDRHVDEEQP